MKPLTPYQRLLTATRKYVSQVRYPNNSIMFRFNKSDIDADSMWSLTIMRAKVETANSLGYDVRVDYSDGALIFRYVEQPGEIGYDI